MGVGVQRNYILLLETIDKIDFFTTHGGVYKFVVLIPKEHQ